MKKRGKKRGVRGNRKGGAFERKISKRLSLWISGGKRDDLFWRTAMSGGRSTLALKLGQLNQNQAGDIGALSGEGAVLLEKLVFECKFYKNLNIDSALLLGKKSKLAKFWRIHVKLAGEHGKEPILIAKQNYTPAIMLMTPRGLGRLEAFGKVPIVLRTETLGVELVLVALLDQVLTIKKLKKHVNPGHR